MTNLIRPADLRLDRSILIDFLSAHLGSRAGARFDWLYLENPDGPALAWMAVDGAGKTIGVSAAFPRKIFIGDSTHPCYVLGDFCIDPLHRTLGLAVQLQRASLEQLGSCCSCAAYDFPSAQMMAIYQRMNIAAFDEMVRWAKPLRIDRKMSDLAVPRVLVHIVAPPVNRLLEWKDRVFLSNRRWIIDEYRQNCDREFTELAYKVGSRYGICVERSANYLNWRYLRHPLVDYRIMTARRDRDLLGYLVFCRNKYDAKIVDLFGLSCPGMWTALLAQLLERLRAQEVVTLGASALASSPWKGVLKKLGFHPRESAPVVVCRAADTITNENGPWYLMDGDRES